VTSMGPRRVALGTVQFGLPYGVANVTGQVDQDEAARILAAGAAAGLDTLDTAIAYGESERRLGELGVDAWRVVSKLPGIPEGSADVSDWARAAIRGSLERLRLPRLAGLLLHRPADLLGPHGPALYAVLREARDGGLTDAIGVSIYAPDELDALGGRFAFDIVQAPFNIVDQRLATSGWLGRLHDAGTEVHTRSAFLQGLLLMSPEARPAAFARWRALWDRWDGWLAEGDRSPLEACLAFVLSHAEIHRVVVGVDSLAQLREILASTEPGAVAVPAGMAVDDLDLITPSRWSAL
jgi:aryl-alcohol dehydrogenase-like predicted oxidoreductase